MSRADKLSNYILLVLEKKVNDLFTDGGHLTMNTQTSSKYGTMMWQYVLLTHKSHDNKREFLSAKADGTVILVEFLTILKI